jgi:hypothetical protein
VFVSAFDPDYKVEIYIVAADDTCVQECVVREIRTLRAMWRGLKQRRQSSTLPRSVQR